MYAGRDFSNIQDGESDVFSLEFTRELANGRTISAPVFTCIVTATDAGAVIDSDPGSCIIGVANITTEINPVDGSLRTFANQQVGNMILGNKYAIEATVTTSDGCTLKRYSHVYCASIT